MSRIRILPQIYLQDGDIICNGNVIPLGRKPLTQKLFKVFIERQMKPINRKELIEAIYGQQHVSRSRRYQKAIEQNVLKLVSRARQLADEVVKVSHCRWIEWFYFNNEMNCWEFYRLTNGYLQDKQGQLRELESDDPLD